MSNEFLIIIMALSARVFRSMAPVVSPPRQTVKHVSTGYELRSGSNNTAPASIIKFVIYQSGSFHFRFQFENFMFFPFRRRAVSLRFMRKNVRFLDNKIKLKMHFELGENAQLTHRHQRASGIL